MTKILDKAREKNVKIHLPTDFVTGEKFAEDTATGTATVESGIPDDWMGLGKILIRRKIN